MFLNTEARETRNPAPQAARCTNQNHQKSEPHGHNH